MLKQVPTMYMDNTPNMELEERITDIIYYLGQMYDGNHLTPYQIALLQQLGLKTLNRNYDE